MKKLMVLLSAALMLLICVGCDDGKELDNSVTDEIGTTDETKQSDENKTTGDITMEDVMNHDESPASDFLCVDDGNGGLILRRYVGDAEIVVIPEEIDGKPVVKIPQYVFANSSPVKGIKLSSTVKEIDGFAFALNKNLQYVVLGESVETIGQAAFQACTSLKEITINNNLKVIKQLAFSQCTALKSIILPDSVETIEGLAVNMMADDFKIIGKAGSAAEAFANLESIPFEAK